MEVALEQCGVDDLKEFLAALYGWRSFHERRRGGRIRVIQLLHQMTAFLHQT